MNTLENPQQNNSKDSGTNKWANILVRVAAGLTLLACTNLEKEYELVSIENEVEVLFLYTDEAGFGILNGGTGSVDAAVTTWAKHWVEMTNYTLERSGINLAVKLAQNDNNEDGIKSVGSADDIKDEINMPPNLAEDQMTSSDARQWLRDNTNDSSHILHGLRHDFKADIIMMFTGELVGANGTTTPTDPTGQANISEGDLEEDYKYAMGVVEWNQGRSIPHEFGHIFGARHDTDTQENGGSVPEVPTVSYNHAYPGYRSEAQNSVETMMSKHGGAFTRIPVFSNPYYIYNGEQMGTRTGTSAKYNACVIERLASYMEDYYKFWSNPDEYDDVTLGESPDCTLSNTVHKCQEGVVETEEELKEYMGCTQVDGNLIIQGNAIESLYARTGSVMAQIHPLQHLRRVKGSLTIQNMEGLTSRTISLPNLEYIKDDLNILSTNATKVWMPILETIGKRLTIDGNPGLSQIGSFPKLTTLSEIVVSNNQNMTSCQLPSTLTSSPSVEGNDNNGCVVN